MNEYEYDSAESNKEWLNEELSEDFAGVPKTDIAKAIGIDRGTLDDWLSGKTKLTPDRFQKAIDGLNALSKERGRALLDIDAYHGDTQTARSLEIADLAREVLQKIIAQLSACDLVTLEAVAYGLFKDDPRLQLKFYDCKPPKSPTPNEDPAEIERAWQTAMTNAEEELQPARDIERMHNELIRATTQDVDVEGMDMLYTSWQEADQVGRGASLQQYIYAHNWFEAWPENHKDEYNYFILMARIREFDRMLQETDPKYQNQNVNEGK